jgi:hypothetical protein
MKTAADNLVTRTACEQHTRSMLESQQAMLVKLDGIEKRLFRDNGSVSMQTRLDRHEQALRLLLWVTGVIGGTLLAGLAGGVALLIREAAMREAGA